MRFFNLMLDSAGLEGQPTFKNTHVAVLVLTVLEQETCRNRQRM